MNSGPSKLFAVFRGRFEKQQPITQHLFFTALACLCAIGLPAMARAQGGATITGIVRDPSGAVLPGVTVEASSPVLIEKVRSVVSAGDGQYRIVNLLPGTYTLTAMLTRMGVEARDFKRTRGAEA